MGCISTCCHSSVFGENNADEAVNDSRRNDGDDSPGCGGRVVSVVDSASAVGDLRAFDNAFAWEGLEDRVGKRTRESRPGLLILPPTEVGRSGKSVRLCRLSSLRRRRFGRSLCLLSKTLPSSMYAEARAVIIVAVFLTCERHVVHHEDHFDSKY